MPHHYQSDCRGELARQGTHGTSVPGVARTLIEEGIRLAIKDGLLSIRDTSKG